MENWRYFAFFTFCAVNQFTLQLGFDSIGNSPIVRKEILNSARQQFWNRTENHEIAKKAWSSRFGGFSKMSDFVQLDHNFLLNPSFNKKFNQERGEILRKKNLDQRGMSEGVDGNLFIWSMPPQTPRTLAYPPPPTPPNNPPNHTSWKLIKCAQVIGTSCLRHQYLKTLLE